MPEPQPLAAGPHHRAAPAQEGGVITEGYIVSAGYEPICLCVPQKPNRPGTVHAAHCPVAAAYALEVQAEKLRASEANAERAERGRRYAQGAPS